MNSAFDFREDIVKCVDALRAGGIILYPSDTEWSLGCDATNAAAVQKLFELINKNDAYNSTVLIDIPSKLQTYLEEVPEMAWDLIELSEKPLTIIYSEPKNLAINLYSSDNTIAIRVSKDEFSRNLCTRFRNPIVAVSPNLKDNKKPLVFSQIDKELISKLDYVVSFKQNETNIPTQPSIISLGKGNLFKLIKE